VSVLEKIVSAEMVALISSRKGLERVLYYVTFGACGNC